MSDIPETIISKGPQKKVASAPAKEKTALPQTIGKYKVISVIAKGVYHMWLLRVNAAGNRDQPFAHLHGTHDILVFTELV